MIRYASQAEVARWCGVTPQTVSNWMTRYVVYDKDGNVTGMATPAPDVVIGEESDRRHKSYGWLPERREEWEAFAAAPYHREAGAGALLPAEARSATRRRAILRQLARFPVAAPGADVVSLAFAQRTGTGTISHWLKALQHEGLVEASKRRGQGKQWRLTEEGREAAAVTSSVPGDDGLTRRERAALAASYRASAGADLTTADLDGLRGDIGTGTLPRRALRPAG